MKKILILLLAAVVGISAVEAQQLTKRQLKAQQKELKKEVAGYVAEGWKVNPGDLNITEQVSRGKSFRNMLDENGESKYVVAQVTAVGQTYKAAQFAAQSGAKIDKLNLDYYIEQTLDEDIVDEIYEYFREEAESDSLEAAMEDLGDDYDEMEVRLVRIKFLCEVAN